MSQAIRLAAQVTLVGRVAEPPARTVNGAGDTIVSFPLRVRRGRSDPTAPVFTVTTWAGMAERVMTELREGSPVLVVGQLQQTSRGPVVRAAELGLRLVPGGPGDPDGIER